MKRPFEFKQLKVAEPMQSRSTAAAGLSATESMHSTAFGDYHYAASPLRGGKERENSSVKMNDSPAMDAQSGKSDRTHNNPRQLAQQQHFDRFHNSPVQVAQRKKLESLCGVAQRAPDDELAQEKSASEAPVQLAQQPAAKPNHPGLPDNLKSGIESLSGMSMDNVKVHYNSSQPAQLNALAYAQGTDIHVAPGQEQHLPHEAWHVVQQAQGRVQPTVQMKEGVPVNDDMSLEHEADVMGTRAVQMLGGRESRNARPGPDVHGALSSEATPLQRKIMFDINMPVHYTQEAYLNGLFEVAEKDRDFAETIRIVLGEGEKVTKYSYFKAIKVLWLAIAQEASITITLDGDFEKSWGLFKSLIGVINVQAAKQIVDKESSVDRHALSKAMQDIPKTSQSGHEKRNKAINYNINTLFPPAFRYQDQLNGDRPLIEDNPLSDRIDYHTWDNLSDIQRETLIFFAKTQDQRLKQKLIEEVLAEAKKVKENNESIEKGEQPLHKQEDDYVVAILSLLQDDVDALQDLKTQKNIVKDYLKVMQQVRSGKSKEVKVKFSKSSAKDKTATKWQENIPKGFLPFQQQRESIKDKLSEEERLVIRKWATANTNVQKHSSNLGVGMALDIQRLNSKKKVEVTEVTNTLKEVMYLDYVLSKLPPVAGRVYAAYPHNPSLQEGDFFSQGSAMSTSESEGGTVTFSKGSGIYDRYVITAIGDSGIPIAQLAPGDGQHQREVLFRARAKFKITRIEEGDFGANVTRLVHMQEIPSATEISALPKKQQGQRYVDLKQVQTSQDLLLDDKTSWVTRLAQVNKLPQAAQRWFLSNVTGGYIEDAETASVQFPYGRETAVNWHRAITAKIDLEELFTVNGFRKIAGLIRGESPADIHLIGESEDPGGWGAAEHRGDQEIAVLQGLGLDVLRPYTVDLIKVPKNLRQLVLNAIVPSMLGGVVGQQGNDHYIVLPQQDFSKTNCKPFNIASQDTAPLVWYSIGYVNYLPKGGYGDITKDGHWAILLRNILRVDTNVIYLDDIDAAKFGLKVDKSKDKNKVQVRYGRENKEQALRRLFERVAGLAGQTDKTDLDAVLSFAAQVQQQISVIHPMHDGNGRVSRAYAYLIIRQLFPSLQLEQYPIFNQDDDQTTSAKDWGRQFAEAIRQQGRRQVGVASEQRQKKFIQDNTIKMQDIAGFLLQGDDYNKTWARLIGMGETLLNPYWGAAIKVLQQDREIAEKQPEKLADVPRELMLLATQLDLGSLTKKIKKVYTDWVSRDIADIEAVKKLMLDALDLRDSVFIGLVEAMQQEDMSQAFTGGFSKPEDKSGGDGGLGGSKQGDKPTGLLGNLQSMLQDQSRQPSQGFVERLGLQLESAQERVAGGDPGLTGLAFQVVHHYNEINHGVNEYLIAYMVSVETGKNEQAQAVYDRLVKTIIPRAQLFYTWEEEVENVQLQWVQSQGLPRGVLWQEEMQERTRLAERWMDLHVGAFGQLDAAQQKTINDALGAADRAQREAKQIQRVRELFVEGRQLYDGNCLFAAFIDPNDQVSVERADGIRARIIAQLDANEIAQTPLAEIRPFLGDNTAVQAYDAMRTNGINLKRYQAFMGVSGVWGGDPEIRAWSRIDLRIIYVIEPGVARFRAFANGQEMQMQDDVKVLGQVQAGDAIAIRSNGGHYARLLPRMQQSSLNQPMASQLNVSGSQGGNQSGGMMGGFTFGSSLLGNASTSMSMLMQNIGNQTNSSRKKKHVLNQQKNGITRYKKRKALDGQEDLRIPIEYGLPKKRQKQQTKNLFKCEICEKTYSSEVSLHNHKKIKHPEK